MKLEYRSDGSIAVAHYGIVISPEDVDATVRNDGHFGRVRFAASYGINSNQALYLQRLVRRGILERKALQSDHVPLNAPESPPAARGRNPGPYASPPAIDVPTPSVEGVTTKEHRPDVQELYRRAVDDYEEANSLVLKKKAQSISFDSGPICLTFVADTHIGGKGADVARMFEEAKLIQDTPGMHAVFVGDLVDNFIIGRLKMVHLTGARMTIEDEWALARYYLKILRPIAFVGGNHDYWTKKVGGVDPLMDVVPEGALFDNDELVFDLNVGDATHSVIGRHKWKGRSQWNPFHAQVKGMTLERPGHDIYVGAHTHALGGYADFVAGGRPVGAVQCGAYKRIDSFAKEIGFQEPNASTAVSVIFDGQGNWWGMNNLNAAAYQMRRVYG